MNGYAVASVCFRSPVEAAAAACSSVSGTTSAGVVSCASPVVTGSTLTYQLKVEGAATSSRAVTVELQDCEPYDWQFFEPVVGAWFLALVVILSARMVYNKVFNRETA